MSDEHDEEEHTEHSANLAPDADAADDIDPTDIGISAEEAGVDVSHVDIDPEDVDVDDISDLSMDELVALSTGGVVDEEGNAHAFGEEGMAEAPGDMFGSGMEPEEEQSPEETAEKLSEHLDEISEEDNSTQQEMFTDEWMAAHTDFEDIEAFLAAGSWESGTEIWDIETAKLDEHTAANTEFDTWQEMSQAAGDEWMDDKLSFLKDADGENDE